MLGSVSILGTKFSLNKTGKIRCDTYCKITYQFEKVEAMKEKAVNMWLIGLHKG